ncbi:MAG TPA: hypothetical protein VMQ17_00860 [Candidatus Sulfotelmatobacter sp.]|nr:hypothetical protein [Candidatus Sulfotelmatobacter sp.]
MSWEYGAIGGNVMTLLWLGQTGLWNGAAWKAVADYAANPSESSAMQAWQIFAVGVAVLVAALLLPSYEPMLAGLAALAMVTVVVTGFLFRPRKDVFYLRTTLIVSEPDYPISVEHDRIAVRVELARLWLLFLPTFGALAFLIVTFAKGSTWSFSLLDRFWELGSYPIFLGIRVFLVVVVGLLSAWGSGGCSETLKRAVRIRYPVREVAFCTASKTASVNTMAARRFPLP